MAEATGLALLRSPFPEHQISKLPKPTKKQTDDVRADFKKGIRCQICGAWHHPDVIHLDYVGHAALTDRLLDADPEWSWKPMATDEQGLPAIDRNGGLWIMLTVCGVTRLGYGSADGKTGGDAVKELIGDGLRNAAMRFGAALDLWHKGDLHLEDTEQPKVEESQSITDEQRDIIMGLLQAKSIEVRAFCHYGKIGSLKDLDANHFDAAKKWIAKQQPRKNETQENILEDDGIPY